MNHFHILLPFGLPSSEIAPDLLRELKTPALAMLLARAQAPACREFPVFSPALPHEFWLAEQLGMISGMVTENSPPVATNCMKSLHLMPDDGIWFVLHPVHIHIARDHLVLTDRRHIQLSNQDSCALFQIAETLFQESGKMLRYGSADTWFVRADDWHALRTATPDAACGHNIDIWMPKGEGDRAWRKLQNEVQIGWHEHAVNTVRAAQGLLPVNSLWLYGGANASLPLTGKAIACSGQPSCAIGTASAYPDLSALLSSEPDPHLLVLDDLCEAALVEDWSNWLEGMHALEEKWFAPLLGALRENKTGPFTLIFGHHAQLREFTLHKRSLYKFWARPSLARLLP